MNAAPKVFHAGQMPMNTPLKAGLSDVPLLSRYLNNATFAPEDSAINAEEQTFTLDLARICYEQGEKGKSLLFLPVVRYPRVASRLTVTGVRDVAEFWLDEKYNIRDYFLYLETLELDGEGRLLICTEYLTFSIKTTGGTELILQDVAAPDPANHLTDYSSEQKRFPQMEAINRLRERFRQS